ncbi:hypothetical protein V1478_000640 [Vespula squamosa]|uniref:CUB domain-containing protein n=1 Tax=Vespula squamosa TaxID=30214 RepID=A0ABD2C630_VESSQ
MQGTKLHRMRDKTNSASLHNDDRPFDILYEKGLDSGIPIKTIGDTYVNDFSHGTEISWKGVLKKNCSRRSRSHTVGHFATPSHSVSSPPFILASWCTPAAASGISCCARSEKGVKQAERLGRKRDYKQKRELGRYSWSPLRGGRAVHWKRRKQIGAMDVERRNRADNISNHDEAGPITANPGLCIHPGRLYSPAAPGKLGPSLPSLPPPLSPPLPLPPPPPLPPPLLFQASKPSFNPYESRQPCVYNIAYDPSDIHVAIERKIGDKAVLSKSIQAHLDRGDEGAPRWKRIRYSDMVLSTYTVSTDDDHASFAFESMVYSSLEILLPDIAVCIFYNQLDVPTNAYSILDDRFESRVLASSWPPEIPSRNSFLKNQPLLNRIMITGKREDGRESNTTLPNCPDYVPGSNNYPALAAEVATEAAATAATATAR